MSTYDDQTFLSWRSTFEIDVAGVAGIAGRRADVLRRRQLGRCLGDLRNATYIATMMESRLGHGRHHRRADGVQGRARRRRWRVSHRGHDKDDAEAQHRSSMGNRIEMRLGNILDEATRVLHEHRHMVLAIAHALETHKTISGDDIAAIFEGRQGPKVNGRDYHHPSFIEVADRYHNEALVAHRMTGSSRGPVAGAGTRQLTPAGGSFAAAAAAAAST